MGACEPSTGDWLTAADGARWLRAMVYEYRSGYYVAEIRYNTSETPVPDFERRLPEWYADLIARIAAGGRVTGEDVAAMLRLCGVYRPADDALRPQDASERVVPDAAGAVFSVDEGGWYAKLPNGSVIRDRDALPANLPRPGAPLPYSGRDFGPEQRVAARRKYGKRSRFHPRVYARALCIYALVVAGRTDPRP